jgi:hypothetical protein
MMDRTPPPVSLIAALVFSRTLGRSTEIFVDGDLEVRFAARPTNGSQIPHQRDELHFVAAGTARYRVEDKVTTVGPGDVLFAPLMWRTGSRISRRTFPSGCCSTGRRSNWLSLIETGLPSPIRRYQWQLSPTMTGRLNSGFV